MNLDKRHEVDMVYSGFPPEPDHERYTCHDCLPSCKTCGRIGRVMADAFDADRFDVLARGAQNYTIPCPNCTQATAK